MTGKTIQELYILLVEPSVVQSRVIVKSLMDAGIHHYDVVHDGQSALQLLSQFHPDLVVSAMYLPDMTAADLVHAIREDAETQRIAFMLITSETGFEYLDPIRQAGVTAMLPKPFEFSQLKRALLNTVDILNPDQHDLKELNAEDMKVLVVDDSSMARKHIRRVLNSMGIDQISEADDGASAVPVLETNFFDFVVTDYNMPQMDGKALLDHIRHKSNQRSLPVLMVTSEGDMSKLAAVEQSGVSGICDKPFEVDTVRALIRNMMTQV
ncbi:MAG: response regulator [Gammaproteobacteria bacterium]|jgi:two-component system, chemotaxis family, chemotaxis protein CheY|nr:response regulator [Gammaproteobacteria bacterium]